MHRAFTLVELLVVVGMIAILMGAMTTAVQSARERARIQKATNDVKVISQAILAYEIWNGDELQEMTDEDATGDSLGFLIGKKAPKGVAGGSGDADPLVLLMAQIRNDGKIVDPWGTPYKVKIKKSSANFRFNTVTGPLSTGYWLPNFYRNWED